MARFHLVLLDACAVVNLYATRKMSEILAAVDGSVGIVDAVEREVQFVFRGGGGEDAREREPVDLLPLLRSASISLVSSDDELELLTFIDLTQELDEGEAMTAAIAIHRAAVVVTDDRKAVRVLRSRGVECWSTLSLLKQWVEINGLADHVVRPILVDLRERGTYDPPRSHPLREWWDVIYYTI